MGDDEGTALAKQLIEYEHAHEVIQQRQKKLLNDYEKVVDEKISIYNQIKAIEREKVRSNPHETLQNYLNEVSKEWITDDYDEEHDHSRYFDHPEENPKNNIPYDPNDWTRQGRSPSWKA